MALLISCPSSCSTGDKCVLNFKPCGMFGKELHKVEGYIQDKRYEVIATSTTELIFCNVQKPTYTLPAQFLLSLFPFLSYFPCTPLFSKKKLCVIYGKWTECMWSVDPQVYETHKKSEKKDNKKQKNVRTSWNTWNLTPVLLNIHIVMKL